MRRFFPYFAEAADPADGGGDGTADSRQPTLFPRTILGGDPSPVADTPPRQIEGFEPEAWRNFVPTDLANHDALSKLTNYEDLVRGYITAQDTLSGSVQVPKPDASPDDWSQFYKLIGRPDKIEGYAEALKDEGFEWAEGSEALQEAVFEAGLTAKQVSQLSKAIAKVGQVQQAANERSQDNVIQALRGEWGRNFDTRLGLAQEAIKKFQVEGVSEMLGETGIGNHPTFIKMMAELGQIMASQGMVDGESFGVMSHESAVQEAERLTALPAYSNPRDPDHERVVKEATRLFNIAYGDSLVEG